MIDELFDSAQRAADRSVELRARAAQVIDEVQRTLELRDQRSLGAGRLQELADEVVGLRRAMESRAVIEQAKGIVIGATGCDADRAFEILVQQSQHENRKLAEIAADLVASKVGRVTPRRG